LFNNILFYNAKGICGEKRKKTKNEKRKKRKTKNEKFYFLLGDFLFFGILKFKTSLEKIPNPKNKKFFLFCFENIFLKKNLDRR
jgi:hypothetical protein